MKGKTGGKTHEERGKTQDWPRLLGRFDPPQQKFPITALDNTGNSELP